MHPPSKLKKILVNSPYFFSLCTSLTRHIPRIFLYHRFIELHDETGRKIDVDTFEWQLNKIKKAWNVVKLSDYLRMLRNGKKCASKLVILTVDDGYLDFYDVAYPLLKKYDFSATFFPTVNFVEGKIWLWPDRIHYILEQTQKQEITFEFFGKTFNINLCDPKNQQKAWQEMSDFCISITNESKLKFLSFLKKKMEIAVPKFPPPEYAAVNWTQLKEMSINGIEIGSHTLNHSILNKVPVNEISQEILISKNTLEDKLNIEVQTICYPNGRVEDINDNVISEVKKAGYLGGVVIKNNYSNTDRFRMPRMGISNDRLDFLWKLSGMEFLANSCKSILIR